FHEMLDLLTFTHPAEQTSPLGQSAKISCTMSRDSQVGSQPKYLLYDHNDDGQFTGSKDASANAAYLTVMNLQAEDEADYTCVFCYSTPS
uniref:Ig-like domain-containing protein n=1 Tax=Pseudonaja textilis TaxID=8673 RepID=A0A670YTF1_PSETE